MDAQQIALLSSLLDHALDLSEVDREAWLASLGPDVAHLGPTLRELLAKDASLHTGELIDHLPVFTVASDAADIGTFSPGDSVGPYRLQRELGRGGMGEVWLAERSDGHLKRAVALKLPMLSARRSVLVQRFARERDIVGSLTHPHIARLYDAGLADDGQPYLALEHVVGKPITAYCDEHHLDALARVALLRQVMDAVQYAHANLVIHRDLKPSNVLVTADGQAMLLDFGIAKMLQGEQTEADATELTQLGGRALTPEYAAPEQLTGAPVSMGTDVWALGLLLYELLGGQRPFKAPTRSALEQAVLTEDPVRPSEHAGSVLRRMPRDSISDLDTITLKALKKVPAERYATVNALAEDLDRFTRGEAVLAQPDSFGYRMRKFAVRHRVSVAVGTLTAVTLMTASAVALWQAAVARTEAARAQQEATRAQAVQNFMTELFKTSSSDQEDPQAAQRRTARELLDRGVDRIDKALVDAPQARIEVMGTMSGIYQELGLDTEAAELNMRRLAVARQVFAKGDPRLVEVLLSSAGTLQEGPMRAQIPALLKEAIALLDAAGETQSAAMGNAMRSLAHYWRYASLRQFMRSADDAAAFVEKHHPNEAITPGTHMLAARARMAVFDFESAEHRLQAALAAAKRMGAAEGARSVRPLGTLGSALEQQMKFTAAEERLRAALELGRHLDGEDHPETLILKAMYANLLLTIGRTPEGTALHDAVRARLMSDDKRLNPQMRANLEGLLGRTLMARGRPDLAIVDLQKDVEDLRRTLPASGALAMRELQLAEAQLVSGEPGVAQQTLAAAQANWRAFADGEPTPLVDTTFAILEARVKAASGDALGALALLDVDRPAIRMDRLRLLVERSRLMLALHRPAEALSHAQSVVADWRFCLRVTVPCSWKHLPCSGWAKRNEPPAAPRRV